MTWTRSGKAAAISLMIGCIFLQGVHLSAPSSRNVTWYLEKSMSKRFVPRTSPLTAKMGGVDWSAGGSAAKPKEPTAVIKVRARINCVLTRLDNVQSPFSLHSARLETKIVHV